MRIAARWKHQRPRRVLLLSTAAVLAVAGASVAAYDFAGNGAGKTAGAGGGNGAVADPAVGHLSLGQDPTTAGTPSTAASGAAAASSAPQASRAPQTSGGATKPSQSGSKPTPKPSAKGSPKPSTSASSKAATTGGGAPVSVPVPPGWSATGTDSGPLTGNTGLSVTFSLQSRDPQGLAAFATAVSDPASGQYHQFLSNADYANRFGPDPAVRDALASYLTSAGLKVSVKAQDFVTVAGTAAQVSQALQVSLHNYKVGTDVRYAPNGPITLPSDLSAAVLGVRGLDDTPTYAKPTSYGRKPNAATGAPNCTQGYGTASGLAQLNGAQVDWSPCPYNFQQIRTAYGADKSGLDGRGVTVGIIDVYNPPTLFNDASTYARAHGWPGYFPLQFTVVDDPQTGYTADCGPSGWYGESAMDVQAVHAIAPGANVVYGAAGCASGGVDNLYGMLDWFVSNHLADIVTNSWSEFEASVSPQERAAYDALTQQATAKGIGLYFSTGDCTDENNACGNQKRPPCSSQTATFCNQAADVDFPASHPGVTAVGGTSMALDAQGNRLFDAPWTDAYYLPNPNAAQAPTTPWLKATGGTGLGSGSGGGISTAPGHPSYQPGSGPRRLPDISMDASPYTGMEFGEHVNAAGDADPAGAYKEVTEGGTSLASPLFAGLQALVQQRLGHAIGFANPRLYQMAGSPAINDVVQKAQNGQEMLMGIPWPNGLELVAEEPSGKQACGTNGVAADCAGFDLATGLGTPSTSYIGAY